MDKELKKKLEKAIYARIDGKTVSVIFVPAFKDLFTVFWDWLNNNPTIIRAEINE